MNYQPLLDLQRDFFRSHQTIPVSNRLEALDQLAKTIKKYEGQIQEALYLDLGKAAQESFMTEIGQVYDEIRVQKEHLRSYARAKWAWSPLSQFPSTSEIQPIPYGNVLIISPWNYPFALCMAPLADAIAAGNTAILKPSEYSIHTSHVVEKIITNAFEPQYVSVVQGDAEPTQALLDLDFDFIFFTGSEKIGKIVMEKAARHLTPVALELGGKSPVVVDATANLALAAKRIVWGKFLNAGQTCVAPDYVLVEDTVKEEFLQLLKHQIQIQYPDPAEIGKIITERHYNRLVSLLEHSQIAYGGLASQPTLQISPTLVYPCSFEDPIMQEEIFGPILPVLGYSDFYAMMDQLQKMPTPLSFYLFTKDPLKKKYFKEVQPFGGGCINDVVIQVANPSIPFGGMKQSGLGQYHGRYGFETFSHSKGLMEKYGIDIPVRYHNFDEKMKSLMLRFFFKTP